MPIDEKRKLEEGRAFEGKLDEMLFRLKYIFPNGNKRKDVLKKTERDASREKRKVMA